MDIMNPDKARANTAGEYLTQIDGIRAAGGDTELSYRAPHRAIYDNGV